MKHVKIYFAVNTLAAMKTLFFVFVFLKERLGVLGVGEGRGGGGGGHVLIDTHFQSVSKKYFSLHLVQKKTCLPVSALF